MINRLITSVLCGLVTIGTVVQADPTRPKLVVGIVVDQLRTDYIEYLRSLFGPDGFNRLMEQGAYLRNVDFNVWDPDLAQSTAVISTGSMPSNTGVPSATVYDQTARKGVAPLAAGNSYSPEALRLSTISDEIAADGLGMSRIYSLAADPQQAVIMGGHAANCVYWIDENTGRWTTSPYYHDKVALMGARGRNGVDARIDTMQWRPALPVDKYPGLPSELKTYPFRHTFSRSDREVYRRFNATPLANREVTDLAIEYLKQLHIGTRGEAIDMLNIGYTAAPYPYSKGDDSRLELQDAYVRLDSDLGCLFSAIDRYVGLDNTLIYLASTGYYRENATDDAKYRIPSGTFSAKRAVSLLNSFLSAKYGNGDYVSGYHDGQFYLNTRTLDDNRADADVAAAEGALFLSRMSGVADAYTRLQVLSAGSDDTRRLRNSTDMTLAGDIIVGFIPGWKIVDDTVYPEVVKTSRQSAVATPFFLMSRDVEPQIISETIDAALLAPTVTQTLRIRSPNGAAKRPLLLNAPR